MEGVVVDIIPGICGFDCRVQAQRSEKRKAQISITGSECTLIQTLDQLINEISMKDLFIPLTKNPIFIAAEKANCHLACPIPVAIVKATEVALELAVSKDASICFVK